MLSLLALMLCSPAVAGVGTVGDGVSGTWLQTVGESGSGQSRGNGENSVSIPLFVPAALLTPSVALSYSDGSSPISAIAPGWAMSAGLKLVKPTLRSQERDLLDQYGNPVDDPWTIRGAGLGGTIHEVGGGVFQYYRHPEKRVRLSTSASDFTLETDGATHRFSPAPTIFGDSDVAYRIVESTDQYGNTIEYSYDASLPGEPLSSIEYGGTDTAPHPYRVDFLYSNRDIATVAVHGELTELGYTLDEVVVSSRSRYGTADVVSYELERSADSSGREYVDNIWARNKDGDRRLLRAFEYERDRTKITDNPDRVSASIVPVPSVSSAYDGDATNLPDVVGSTTVFDGLFDISGDGRADFVSAYDGNWSVLGPGTPEPVSSNGSVSVAGTGADQVAVQLPFDSFYGTRNDSNVVLPPDLPSFGRGSPAGAVQRSYVFQVDEFHASRRVTTQLLADVDGDQHLDLILAVQEDPNELVAASPSAFPDVDSVLYSDGSYTWQICYGTHHGFADCDSESDFQEVSAPVLSPSMGNVAPKPTLDSIQNNAPLGLSQVSLSARGDTDALTSNLDDDLVMLHDFDRDGWADLVVHPSAVDPSSQQLHVYYALGGRDLGWSSTPQLYDFPWLGFGFRGMQVRFEWVIDSSFPGYEDADADSIIDPDAIIGKFVDESWSVYEFHDLNADGFMDVVYAPSSDWEVYFGYEGGWDDQAVIWEAPTPYIRRSEEPRWTSMGAPALNISSGVALRMEVPDLSIFYGDDYGVNGGFDPNLPPPSPLNDTVAIQRTGKVLTGLRDVDADGLDDLVDYIPTLDGTGLELVWYRNTGSGFTSDFEVFPAALQGPLSEHFVTQGGNPMPVSSLGDFDDDGMLDRALYVVDDEMTGSAWINGQETNIRDWFASGVGNFACDDLSTDSTLDHLPNARCVAVMTMAQERHGLLHGMTYSSGLKTSYQYTRSYGMDFSGSRDLADEFGPVRKAQFLRFEAATDPQTGTERLSRYEYHEPLCTESGCVGFAEVRTQRWLDNVPQSVEIAYSELFEGQVRPVSEVVQMDTALSGLTGDTPTLVELYRKEHVYAPSWPFRLIESRSIQTPENGGMARTTVETRAYSTDGDLTEVRVFDDTTPQDYRSTELEWATSSDGVRRRVIRESNLGMHAGVAGTLLARKEYDYNGVSGTSISTSGTVHLSEIRTCGGSLLTGICDPGDMLTQEFGYTARGAVNYLKDRSGIEMFLGDYTNNGMSAQEVTNGLSQSWRVERDELGLVKRMVDPNGMENTFTHDAWGRTTAAYDKPAGGAAHLSISVNHLDSNDVGTDPDMVETRRWNDGELISSEYVVLDGAGQAWISYTSHPTMSGWIVYESMSDLEGHVLGTSRARFATQPPTQNLLRGTSVQSRAYFDGLGRVRRQWDNFAAAPTEFMKTDYPRPGVSVSTDGMGFERVVERDIFGAVHTISDGNDTNHLGLRRSMLFAAGSSPVTTGTATYDGLGRLCEYHDANGNRWVYAYDGASRLTEVGRAPISGGAVEVFRSYTYDGDLATAQFDGPATGAPSVEWGYDVLGRSIERIVAAGGSSGLSTTEQTTWDTGWIGAVASTTDAAGTRSFGYDGMGRLEWEHRDFNNGGYLGQAEWSYDYDSAGRLTDTYTPTGSHIGHKYGHGGSPISTIYHHDANLDGVVGPTEAFTTILYDFDAQGVNNFWSSSMGVAGGLERTLRDDQISGVWLDHSGMASGAGHAAAASSRIQYEYYENGYVSTKDYKADNLGFPEMRLQYTYDELRRVAEVTIDNGVQKALVEDYEYDRAGNPTYTQVFGGSPLDLEYEQATRFNEMSARYTAGTPDWEAFDWDSTTGRLIEWTKHQSTGTRIHTMEYDGLGRLTRMSDSDYPMADNVYLYDASDGLAVERNAETGAHVLRDSGWQYDHATGETIESVLPMVSLRRSGATTEFVWQLRELDGRVFETSIFGGVGASQRGVEIASAFGDVLVSHGSSWDVGAWNGAERNVSTGLTHHGRRHAETGTGMWMQPEPLLGLGAVDPRGTLGFTGVYAGGDPINFQDRSGFQSALISSIYTIDVYVGQMLDDGTWLSEVYTVTGSNFVNVVDADDGMLDAASPSELQNQGPSDQMREFAGLYAEKLMEQMQTQLGEAVSALGNLDELAQSFFGNPLDIAAALVRLLAQLNPATKFGMALWDAYKLYPVVEKALRDALLLIETGDLEGAADAAAKATVMAGLSMAIGRLGPRRRKDRTKDEEGGCFVAGSGVLVVDGTIPIESVVHGDRVFAADVVHESDQTWETVSLEPDVTGQGSESRGLCDRMVTSGHGLILPAILAACAPVQAAEVPSDVAVVEVYDARTGTWQDGIVGETDGGDEILFDGNLLVRQEAGFENRGLVDPWELSRADATFRVGGVAEYPSAMDWVLVLSSDGGPSHVRLAEVEDAAHFAYDGRVFEAAVDEEQLAIRPTGDVLGRVVNNFVRVAPGTIDAEIAYANGATDLLTGTPNHPFWVPEVRDYVALEDIRVGTVLRTFGGAEATVVGMTSRPGDVEVFDVEVLGPHNFYVRGAASDAPAVLVHNSSPNPKPIPNGTAGDIALITKALDETGRLPEGYTRRGYLQGGKIWKNRDGDLPEPVGTWREADVGDIRVGPGGTRGAERVLYDNAGNLWYTPDHYKTFIPVRTGRTME